MNGSVLVSGACLEVVHKRGEFEGRAFDFHLAHVLVGSKVIEVRYNPDNGDVVLPREGENVEVYVELPKGARPIAKRSKVAAASVHKAS